jgi:hypothetical protein
MSDYLELVKRRESCRNFDPNAPWKKKSWSAAPSGLACALRLQRPALAVSDRDNRSLPKSCARL